LRRAPGRRQLFVLDVLRHGVMAWGRGGLHPVCLAAMSDVAPDASGLASGVSHVVHDGRALGLAILASLAAAHTEAWPLGLPMPFTALNSGYTGIPPGAIAAATASVLDGAFVRTRTHGLAQGEASSAASSEAVWSLLLPDLPGNSDHRSPDQAGSADKRASGAAAAAARVVKGESSAVQDDFFTYQTGHLRVATTSSARPALRLAQEPVHGRVSD